MSDSPEIRTTLGIVRGEEAAGIRRFLGIPYAAPPFGPNRFRAPQPVAAWTGVRETTAFGPTPPQLPYAGATAALLGNVRIDGEDILTVNVWTPAGTEHAPVALWIHGGALERGTAAVPLYDGAPFARAGIVFVSINYRLGSEGFSVLDDAPRNLGLLDALQGDDSVRMAGNDAPPRARRRDKRDVDPVHPHRRPRLAVFRPRPLDPAVRHREHDLPQRRTAGLDLLP